MDAALQRQQEDNASF